MDKTSPRGLWHMATAGAFGPLVFVGQVFRIYTVTKVVHPANRVLGDGQLEYLWDVPDHSHFP